MTINNVLIKNLPHGNVHIYIDNPERYIAEIGDTNGVINVSTYSTIRDLIFVTVSPRFDKDKVVEDLENLLNSEIPSVFKE